MDRLKPTTDVVFKLLLQRDPELRLLRSMLECILKPSSPINSLEVLNREIEPDSPTDKPIALDVRVRLDNLIRIDIEMQTQVVASTASRFLYYWARDFGDGLRRGEEYAKIVPIMQIIWLGENLIKSPQFHSVFHVSEDTTHERFSADLEIHTLELPKLHLLSSGSNPKLYRWSRFLVAKTDEEFETLAKEDADMAEAKHSLEEISSDPDLRAIAYKRETALRGYYHTLAAEREESEAKGRVEGLAEGLRNTLIRQLVKRFGELPDWASNRISHAAPAQLETYLDDVLTAQSLDDVLRRNA